MLSELFNLVVSHSNRLDHRFVPVPAAAGPALTKVGCSRPGLNAYGSVIFFCQGSLHPAPISRARHNSAYAATITQIQVSAADGECSFGLVQPRSCFRNRKVCSRSKRRRYTDHQ